MKMRILFYAYCPRPAAENAVIAPYFLMVSFLSSFPITYTFGKQCEITNEDALANMTNNEPLTGNIGNMVI